MSEQLGRIRINKAPQGCPEEVGKWWIDLELPCTFKVLAGTIQVFNIQTQTLAPSECNGYKVPAAAALAIYAVGAPPDAVSFYTNDDGYTDLMFREDEVDVLETPPIQMVEVRERRYK